MSPQEETLLLPTLDSIKCPACGTSNTPDSKFCRHCGQLLRAPAPGARLVVPALEEGDDVLTSPQEIDARRARQLLDRALQLSERGELSAAILACRQASTLDAHNPDAFAMLGTLLERNGDVRGATSAYERVLSLAPDNVLERESLARLRARLDRAPAFHFDPDELFSNDEILPSIAPDAPLAQEVAAPDPDATSELKVEEPRTEAELSGAEGAPSAGIDARLPPTNASLSARNPLNPDQHPATSSDGESLSPEGPFLEENASAPVAAYAPIAGASGLASAEDQADPFWQALAGSGERESGSGKPAVSSLAQALDLETLAIVGEKSAAPTPTRGAPSIEKRQRQRRQVNLPIAIERRVRERRAPVGASGLRFTPVPRAADPFVPGGASPSGVRPLDFQFPSSQPARLPVWAHLLRSSSFFARTLPLIAVGVLSLSFLSWARSQALAREAERAASAPAVTTGETSTSPQTVAPAQTTGVATQNTANAVSNPAGGFVISNAPVIPTPAAPAAPTPSSSNVNPPAARPPVARPGAAPQAGAPRSGSAHRPAPVFPRAVPLAPAPVPPPASPSSGGNILLPPPRVDIPPPAEPPIQVGSALSPAGSPQQGPIHITQGTIIRSTAPARTGSAARSAERDAAQAARNGNNESAINNLTNAIDSTGGDTGYLYQQRAMAFMQRGNSARAATDFQAAINAYQDQINRGENVASAQAGLQAARSGLAVAQASG